MLCTHSLASMSDVRWILVHWSRCEWRLAGRFALHLSQFFFYCSQPIVDHLENFLLSYQARIFFSSMHSAKQPVVPIPTWRTTLICTSWSSCVASSISCVSSRTVAISLCRFS